MVEVKEFSLTDKLKLLLGRKKVHDHRELIGPGHLKESRHHQPWHMTVDCLMKRKKKGVRVTAAPLRPAWRGPGDSLIFPSVSRGRSWSVSVLICHNVDNYVFINQSKSCLDKENLWCCLSHTWKDRTGQRGGEEGDETRRDSRMVVDHVTRCRGWDLLSDSGRWESVLLPLSQLSGHLIQQLCLHYWDKDRRDIRERQTFLFLPFSLSLSFLTPMSSFFF